MWLRGRGRRSWGWGVRRVYVCVCQGGRLVKHAARWVVEGEAEPGYREGGTRGTALVRGGRKVVFGARPPPPPSRYHDRDAEDVPDDMRNARRHVAEPRPRGVFQDRAAKEQDGQALEREQNGRQRRRHCDFSTSFLWISLKVSENYVACLARIAWPRGPAVIYLPTLGTVHACVRACGYMYVGGGGVVCWLARRRDGTGRESEVSVEARGSHFGFSNGVCFPCSARFGAVLGERVCICKKKKKKGLVHIYKYLVVILISAPLPH
ncbi:hypothetical protein BS50DRAFT_397687 [Corynespora cassiicola Philippines]|uniref:Uncharacterized protein n=1 Tax=Corynespora cassiicola Philippines TaxID=1448308 RepID=A0A2T2NK26_CORCC|nr:hypothetical protein BS50DRAFT_397687 [Corynespora cassiicola Philippines]